MIHDVKVYKAGNAIEKTFGLIGRDTPIPFLFETRFGIHTFGVRFSIDVVVLNTNNSVVSLKKNLRPNSLYFWNPRYYKVLELPSGEINRKGIRKGDQMKLIIKTSLFKKNFCNLAP